jgi:CelD/BcsL family acetyltransferase involved in cellulose biosynthesis
MVSTPIGQPAPDTLKVVEVDARTDPRWEAFVAAHPGGLVYHHPLWLQVLEHEYGRKPICLACEDTLGHIRGVLPLLTTGGLPFKRGGELTGRRLASLPRTPVAGPLAVDGDATAALVRAAVAYVEREGEMRLQLKVWSNDLDGAIPGLVGIPWRLSYVLQLPGRSEELRFGNSRNHSAIKRAVNKAARMGVEVRQAESEDQLRAWYELYLGTMRWHAVPPRPYRFFKVCWDLLRPHGLIRLLLAEQHEAGHSKLLAGSIFFMFGQTVFYAFNGRRPEDLGLRPNDAIHWRAIHDARSEGYSRFDFGEVVESQHGLAEFKSKWGTEPRRLYRYYYPAPVDLEPDSLEAQGAMRHLANAVWKRLPLRVTSLLGDWIYSYL